MDIHKPPNTHAIDEVWVGMSEDKNGYNGIITTIVPGFGGTPMMTSSAKVLALFKMQASVMAKETQTRIKIYRFARVDVEYDSEKPSG